MGQGRKNPLLNFDSNLLPDSGPPGPDQGSGPVNLEFLLDALEAFEPSWATLPSPLPLFLAESRDGLTKVLETGHG